MKLDSAKQQDVVLVLKTVRVAHIRLGREVSVLTRTCAEASVETPLTVNESIRAAERVVYAFSFQQEYTRG